MTSNEPDSISYGPGCDPSRRSTRQRSRRALPGRIAVGLLTFVAVTSVAITSGADEREAGSDRPRSDSPRLESPRDVLRDRRLEGIYDRVTIGLTYAGGNLTGAEIVVGVEPSGAVTLDGVVGSEAALERAEQIAASKVGVQAVRNRLRVDPTRLESGSGEGESPARPSSADETGAAQPTQPAQPVEATTSTDAALSRAVATALASALPFEARAEREDARDWRVDGVGWRFVVIARDGAVRLEGDVESVDAVERAVEAIERRPDVASVELELELPSKGGFFDWLGF